MDHQCTRRTDLRWSKGFSIIELIIALVMSLVVMSGIYAYCNSHHKSHNIQTRVNEMNQGIRFAMNRMVSEIRMAGFKTGSGTTVFHPFVSTLWWTNYTSSFPFDLAATVPYNTPAMADNMVIRQGACDPRDDMLIFTYADSDPDIQLVDGEPFGETWIKLNTSVEETADRFHKGDIIYIGFGTVRYPVDDLEYAKVVSISNSWLYIDTNPYWGGCQGLVNVGGYRAGTEVGVVNVVSYAVFNDKNDSTFTYHDKGHPVLARKCNIWEFEALVEDIESLEVTAQGNDVQISIVARTSKEEPEYTNPHYGDHFRRRTMTSMVKVRNRE
ncbi:MAG: PilW family protein [bacterium]